MTELADAIAYLPVSVVARLVRWSDPNGLAEERPEAILPRPRSGSCRLSFAQERLWFIDQLQPGNVAYNLVFTLPVAEPVDTELIERALAAVVDRHEALRTTFAMSGGMPVQRVLPELAVAVAEVARSGAEAAIAAEAAWAFDLRTGPLLRATLIRWDASQALLLVNMHHIVSDGISLMVFRREFATCLAALRRGETPDLPELPIQYADFAQWQREWLRGEVLERHLGYWRERLAGAPPLLDLPTDVPRPAVESYRGATQMFSVSPDVTAGLRELARQCQGTLFMVLLAALQALLARLSGETDVVVGSPIANRNRAELENLIGFFVNMLALRSEVAPNLRLRDLVARVRETTLGAYEHQDLPFEKLVDELSPRRSLSHGPIFQNVLVLQNLTGEQPTSETPEIAEPPADAEPSYLAGTAKFDLTLFLEERGEGLLGSCEYRTDLFAHGTIARLIRRFKQVLTAFADDPDIAVADLPVLLPGERELPRRIAAAPPAETARAEPPREAEKPETPVQAVIARIWSDVLKRPVLDIGANFFDLGGNSVSSVQVIARIRDALHVELPLHRLFEAPTIAKIAALVEADHALVLDVGGDAPADPVEAAVPARIGRIHRAPPGPRRLRAPLSFAQERLWFLDQFQPASPVYNLAITVPLDNAADVKHVRRALTAITQRHEVLRTTFPAVGGMPQQVIGPAVPVAVAVSDIGGLDAPRRNDEFAYLLAADAREPFDLARGPLLRARLIHARESGVYLSLVIHHIAFDGWSFGLLLREFDHFYRSFRDGTDPALPDLSVQYADFARWQRRWIGHETFADHLAYWRARLADAPDILQLPTDRPRPAIESHRGATQWFALDQDIAERLRAVARLADTTLFVALLASFQVLLMRWSGQEDIVVGSPIANRTRVEIENLIGFFTNTLVLRTDLSGNPTFLELVARAHRTMMEASEHQDLPFEKIVEDLQPKRHLDRNPLFQAMLVLQNMPGPLDDVSDDAEFWQADVNADGDPRVVPGTAKFDVTLTLIEMGRGLAANLEYNTDLFDDATIARVIRQFRALAAGIAADPSSRIWQLPMLTAADHRRVMDLSWGGDAPLPDEQTVCDLVAAQIARIPRAPAMIAGDRVIDYATLGRRADALARRLRERGVAPGDRVAISLPRSAQALVALLAILRIGAAYVPVDPAYPPARRDFILRDSRAMLLIRPVGAGDAPDRVRVLDLALDADEWEEAGGDVGSRAEPDSTAYVIYTSGSTGTPKGVAMPHRALTNLILWQIALDEKIAPERTLQFTSLSFDVSFQEIFATWSAGGALVLIDDATRTDPGELLATMTRHRVNRLFLPAVALQQIAEAARGLAGPLPPLREVIAAGEQLRITPAIAELFKRLDGCALRNQYGPTETHIVTDYSLDGPPESWPVLPPIGRPIPNVSAYVLDRFGQPAPDGVAGEIFIGGTCVATGYHERPDLTTERFLPDPWRPGERMYRTGDLGIRLASGDIAYLGRADQQLKVRGYRIEPGEVERALTELPDIAEAVVVASGDAADTKRLVAYVVTPARTLRDLQSIREFLARRLPDYMVPWPIVPVDALPLTPSGKVNRGALARAPIATVSSGAAAPPVLPLEELLASHWKNLLHVADIGIDDDFFQSGGHSLLATRAMARLHQDIGLMLPVRILFAAPTIRGLARAIIEAVAERVAAAGGEELIKKLDVAAGRAAA